MMKMERFRKITPSEVMIIRLAYALKVPVTTLMKRFNCSNFTIYRALGNLGKRPGKVKRKQ
jgi:DNA invertase Pin-like site-specific DNA recombinase